MFGKVSHHYLGVDFDTRGVKVVELANDHGRPRLVTYGYFDVSLDGSSKGIEYADLGEIIKSLCRKSKITTTRTISALPAFSVFSSILTFPALPTKDLARAISWEAKKVVPLPIEDTILDWKVLEEQPAGTARLNEEQPAEPADGLGDGLTTRRIIRSTSGKKTVRVLLTAAPKDLVKKYIDTFRAAGLQLLSLDTEAFAVVRSLVGNDKAPVMVVDIGSVVTTITIIVGGIPLLTRSIQAGGFTITTLIAQSLNINLTRAEQFKYDIGINPSQSGQGSVPKIIQQAVTPIVDEIKYSLQLYAGQGQKPIEKIILTGGSSLLAHLPEHLSDVLQLRVYRGDAWARVIYPPDLRPILDEIGPRFSIAVGLAMRDIH